jgi:hypothetical protein
VSQDHLVDTPVRLAQCNRCRSYVWLAMASGVRSAADVAPATHTAWIAAIAEGRRTFRLTRAAGKPHKLLCTPLGAQIPTFGVNGAQEPAQGRPEVVVEHGCGGAARNMLTFQEVEQAPAQTVCETWRASGWLPPPGKCGRERNAALRSCAECDRPPFDLAETGLGTPESIPRVHGDPEAPVRPVNPSHGGEKRASGAAHRPTRQPSATASRADGPRDNPEWVADEVKQLAESRGAATDRRRKMYINLLCDICRTLVGDDPNATALKIGDRWMWAFHDECP